MIDFNPITFEDKNKEAVQRTAYSMWEKNNYRGTLEISVGVGKTYIGLMSIQQNVGKDIIIIVPTVSLMEQWHKELSNVLGVSQYIGRIGNGFKEWDKPIKICIINSIRNIENIYSNLLIMDECLFFNTKILLPNNKYLTIEEIIERDDINTVMSYNHEKKIIEEKKIKRKIKIPFNDYWYKIFVESENKIIELKVTKNHKIWANNEYIKAENLKVGDILKSVDIKSYRLYKCKICEKEFKSHSALGGHTNNHNPENLKLFRKLALEMNKNRKIDYSKVSKSLIEYNKNNPDNAKRSSIRMKLNNPFFNKDIVEKQKKGWKKWWNSISEEEKQRRIKIFMDAPIYNISKPTSYEKVIIDLFIENLRYTGNGTFWVTFKNGRKKNPDFKITGQRKVIEVGDIEFWHTHEEIYETIKEYDKIGIKCLYLTKKDLINLNELKNKINTFILNHDCKIVKIEKLKSFKNKKDFCYNLEVEDNHNYFANNILVSNCHRYGSEENIKFLTNNNFEKILCLTATSKRSDGMQKKIFNYAPLIYKFSQKDAIQKKILCEYDLTNVSIGLTKDEKLEYLKLQNLIEQDFPIFNDSFYAVNKAVYSNLSNRGIACGLLNNFGKRKKLLLNCASRISITSKLIYSMQNRKILVFCEYIDTVKGIIELLKTKGIECGMFHSKMTAKSCEKTLNKFRNNEINVLLAVKSLDEGVNIPDIDCIIITAGSSVEKQIIQRIGRGIRLSEGKSLVNVYQLYIPGSQDYKWMQARLTNLKNNAKNIYWINSNEVII